MSDDALPHLVQAETVRPAPVEHSNDDRLQYKDVAVYVAEWSPSVRWDPEKAACIPYGVCTNHYATAVSPGQGVGGVLKHIFVLGSVICQTDRAYDESLNTLLRDTKVCSKWLGVKNTFQ